MQKPDSRLIKGSLEEALGDRGTVDVFDERSEASATVHNALLEGGSSLLLVFVAGELVEHQACIESKSERPCVENMCLPG